jgi:DNA repair protein RadA/Sms
MEIAKDIGLFVYWIIGIYWVINMKSHTSFVCQQCGNEFASWFGRCPNCGEWNSLVETSKVTGRQTDSKTVRIGGSKPLKLSEIKHIEGKRISTGFVEFDRVLGGGIVPGGVVLIAGDPGVGKSTLLLAMMGKLPGWYVTGEESAEQVKLRAQRLKIVNKEL